MMTPVGFSSNAWADDALNEDLSDADLTTIIQKAREAFESGNFDLAIHRLLMANRKEPNPRLLLNVARSFEQKGDCARSLVYYSAYVRHPDSEADLSVVAKKQLENSASCKGYNDKLSGRLMLESEPGQAMVFVNGDQVGTTPRELAGYPSGRYKIRFEKEGFANSEQEVELRAMSDHTVGAILETPKAPEDDVVVAPIAETPKASSINYAAFALIGAGTIGIIVGAVYDNVFIPETDEERKLVLDNPAEFNRLTEQRQGQETMALVGYVGGGLLLAGGIGWLVYDYMTEQEPQNDDDAIQKRLGLRLTPLFDSQSAGMILQGRF
ncbi:MAG: PEGA domain-containing protein [Bradymonadaceae bacterium]|nr:PEGA domain-containing protein [Lujinxingiaceae bacterium]